MAKLAFAPFCRSLWQDCNMQVGPIAITMMPNAIGTGLAKRGNSALVLAIALAAYATVLIRGSALLADPDVYMHIAVGRWICSRLPTPYRYFLAYHGRRAVGCTRMAARGHFRVAV
jgi:hypothetical protein